MQCRPAVLSSCSRPRRVQQRKQRGQEAKGDHLGGKGGEGGGDGGDGGGAGGSTCNVGGAGSCGIIDSGNDPHHCHHPTICNRVNPL